MTGTVIFSIETEIVQSQRLLSCLLLLQGKRRVTARELATQLDVSMRTVYRDVEALSEAGVPIHMERGPLGGIVLADDYRRALAQFTSDELQTLFAPGSSPMSDLGIATHGQALQKLAGALPAMQRRAIETGRARLLVDHNRWSRGQQPTEILQQLRGASERDRRIMLQYRDRDGAVSRRQLDPLGLVAKAGVWYLIARQAEKGYRTFRATRIESVEELVQTFVRPADFNLEKYWNESVVTIERYSQEMFDVVIRAKRVDIAKLTAFWNVVTVLEDEDVSTVKVAFPSKESAILQLLVLADSVEIESPADLPAAIVERAMAALARFGRTPVF